MTLTELYPEFGRDPVPTASVISEEYFSREKELVFKKSWLQVAREEDLPNKGDYSVIEIEVWNTEIILVRGEDESIRAFHNICLHRGNKLAHCRGPGRTKSFVCGFHGWVYGLNGSLVSVPDEENFFLKEKAKIGLKQCAVGTWNGFVFVHWDRNPSVALRDYLEPIASRLEDYPFSSMRMVLGCKTIVKSNWKVALDAFQEAIHVPFVHSRTVTDSFTSAENPYCHVKWIELYERHRSMSVYGTPNRSATVTPAEKVIFKFGRSFNYGSNEAFSRFPGVNPGRIDNWAFDVNVIFPNFFLDPSVGFYFTMNFWPISVDTTRWEIRYYMPEPATAGEAIVQAYSSAVVRDAACEDLSTLEATQKMLRSGVLEHFLLGDQELALRHNYKVIEDLVCKNRDAKNE